MRLIFILLVLLSVLSSCDSEDQLAGGQYVVLNQVNGKGNISLYDYHSNSLTEQFFTMDTDFGGQIIQANRNGDYIYAAINYYPLNLVKIDVENGTQVKEVEAWINVPPAIDFHNQNVIVCNTDFNTVDEYFFNVKIYDKDLALLDSITITGIYSVETVKVVGERLFCGVRDVQGDYWIKVMDMATRTFIKDMEISSRCTGFIPMKKDRLLCILNNGFFTLDMDSYEVLNPKTVYIGTRNFSLDESKSILYYLYPAAQPSPVANILYKLDISTGESDPASSDPHDYFVGINGPILYDAKAKIIVSGGGLKIFSTEGKVLKTVESPAGTSHLFIQ